MFVCYYYIFLVDKQPLAMPAKRTCLRILSLLTFSAIPALPVLVDLFTLLLSHKPTCCCQTIDDSAQSLHEATKFLCGEKGVHYGDPNLHLTLLSLDYALTYP